MCVCVCVCVCVFFNPVNLELGTIQSGKIKYSTFEYLNIPRKVLNVNKIHRANNTVINLKMEEIGTNLTCQR